MPPVRGGVRVRCCGRHRGLERSVADADGDEGATLAVDRLFQQFGHGGDDGHRQLVFQGAFEPLRRGAGFPDGLEQRVDLVGVGQAVGVDRVVRVLGEIGHAQHGADASPLGGGDDGDADQAVFCGIDADGVVAAETIDPGTFAGCTCVPGDGGFVFRNVDRGFMNADGETAAADRSAVQAGSGGDEGGETGNDAGLAVGCQGWRTLGTTSQGDEATQGPDGGFSGGETGVGAVVAEPGNGGDRQAGLLGAQDVMRWLAIVRRPAVEQQVGAGQQGCDRIGLFGHAALVGVQPGEQAAFAVAEDRRHAAQRVATGGFQLDHVGAEVGEQFTAVVNPDAGAELENAIGGKRHWLWFLDGSGCCPRQWHMPWRVQNPAMVSAGRVASDQDGVTGLTLGGSR